MLTNATLRTLGEFAYGIYLMHGVILFVTFNFIFSLTYIKSLSAFGYWSIVLMITPILIVVCSLIYKFIEYPAMQKSAQVATWLRSFSIFRLELKW
jgi:peptidoglycan/LPS O-acetylase OafA/YrhL